MPFLARTPLGLSMMASQGQSREDVLKLCPTFGEFGIRSCSEAILSVCLHLVDARALPMSR